jgi:WD40 repeat protein
MSRNRPGTNYSQSYSQAGGDYSSGGGHDSGQYSATTDGAFGSPMRPTTGTGFKSGLEASVAFGRTAPGFSAVTGAVRATRRFKNARATGQGTFRSTRAAAANSNLNYATVEYVRKLKNHLGVLAAHRVKRMAKTQRISTLSTHRSEMLRNICGHILLRQLQHFDTSGRMTVTDSDFRKALVCLSDVAEHELRISSLNRATGQKTASASGGAGSGTRDWDMEGGFYQLRSGPGSAASTDRDADPIAALSDRFSVGDGTIDYNAFVNLILESGGGGGGGAGATAGQSQMTRHGFVTTRPEPAKDSRPDLDLNGPFDPGFTVKVEGGVVTKRTQYKRGGERPQATTGWILKAFFCPDQDQRNIGKYVPRRVRYKMGTQFCNTYVQPPAGFDPVQSLRYSGAKPAVGLELEHVHGYRSGVECILKRNGTSQTGATKFKQEGSGSFVGQNVHFCGRCDPNAAGQCASCTLVRDSNNPFTERSPEFPCERPPRFAFFAAAVGVVQQCPVKGEEVKLPVPGGAARPRQRFFQHHDNDIRCISVDPSGTLIATGQQSGGRGDEACVLIWDVETCQRVGEVGRVTAATDDAKREPKATKANLFAVSSNAGPSSAFYERAVSCVCFSSDSRRIVAVGEDNKHTVGVWDWRTGALLAVCPSQNGTPPQVYDVLWRPPPPVASQQHRVTPGSDPAVNSKLLDPHSGCDFITYGAHHVLFWTMGRSAATGKYTLDWKKGKYGTNLPPRLVNCAAWAPAHIGQKNADGSICKAPVHTVVSAGDNGYVFVWDTVTGMCACSFEAHPNSPILGMAFKMPPTQSHFLQPPTEVEEGVLLTCGACGVLRSWQLDPGSKRTRVVPKARGQDRQNAAEYTFFKVLKISTDRPPILDESLKQKGRWKGKSCMENHTAYAATQGWDLALIQTQCAQGLSPTKSAGDLNTTERALMDTLRYPPAPQRNFSFGHQKSAGGDKVLRVPPPLQRLSNGSLTALYTGSL